MRHRYSWSWTHRWRRSSVSTRWRSRVKQQQSDGTFCTGLIGTGGTFVSFIDHHRQRRQGCVCVTYLIARFHSDSFFPFLIMPYHASPPLVEYKWERRESGRGQARINVCLVRSTVTVLGKHEFSPRGWPSKKYPAILLVFHTGCGVSRQIVCLFVYVCILT